MITFRHVCKLKGERTHNLPSRFCLRSGKDRLPTACKDCWHPKAQPARDGWARQQPLTSTAKNESHCGLLTHVAQSMSGLGASQFSTMTQPVEADRHEGVVDFCVTFVYDAFVYIYIYIYIYDLCVVQQIYIFGIHMH